MVRESIITETVTELIKKAETSLPEDIEDKLREAYEKEINELAKIQLREILKNIEFAREQYLPICQDTGLLSFYIKMGEKINVKTSTIKKAIQKAVKISTEKIPLRENTVDPLSRENFGNNLGLQQPNIDFEFSLGEGEDFLEITVFPKGAGSENMSAFKAFQPTLGKEEIKKFVLEKVVEAGGKPCPPIILGIGIGGSSEQAMKMAKVALLRPLGQKNKNKNIAQIEQEILKEINESGIGVMGLGKGVTCLGVNIKISGTHTASLPVAINFGCWAMRRATMRI